MPRPTAHPYTPQHASLQAQPPASFHDTTEKTQRSPRTVQRNAGNPRRNVWSRKCHHPIMSVYHHIVISHPFLLPPESLPRETHKTPPRGSLKKQPRACPREYTPSKGPQILPRMLPRILPRISPKRSAKYPPQEVPGFVHGFYHGFVFFFFV